MFGDLTMASHARQVEERGIQQRHFVRPGDVPPLLQNRRSRIRQVRARTTVPRYAALESTRNESGLRHGARCPARPASVRKPVVSSLVVDVVGVEQRDQHG